MTPEAYYRRRIKLRRQGIELLKQEILSDQIQLALQILKAQLELEAAGDYDPETSRKLDALSILIED